MKVLHLCVLGIPVWIILAAISFRHSFLLLLLFLLGS